MADRTHQCVGCVFLRSGRLAEARQNLREMWGRLQGREHSPQYEALFAHLTAQHASLESREGNTRQARWMAEMVLGNPLFRHIAYGVLARCAAKEFKFPEVHRHLKAAREAAVSCGHSNYLAALDRLEREIAVAQAEVRAE